MCKLKVFTFDNCSLLNVRIVFLIFAFLHLTVTALVTLNIDTTVDEDPRVKAYYYVRWKLLTCWFNLITLAYLPARLYSDWKTKQGEGHSSLVKHLHHASDVVMTGLLFPITLYSDVVFWCMYIKDPELLATPRVFDYLPYWAQHSLHTVSFIVVLLDLVLTPRRRPKTLKPRIALLMTFSFTYILMLYGNYSKGELVYPVLARMNVIQMLLITILSLAFIVMLFAVQWVAIDLLWGTSLNRKKV